MENLNVNLSEIFNQASNYKKAASSTTQLVPGVARPIPSIPEGNYVATITDAKLEVKPHTSYIQLFLNIFFEAKEIKVKKTLFLSASEKDEYYITLSQLLKHDMEYFDPFEPFDLNILCGKVVEVTIEHKDYNGGQISSVKRINREIIPTFNDLNA